MKFSTSVKVRNLLIFSVTTYALVGLYFASGVMQLSHADTDDMYQAKFNASGELIRPEGWREWPYVGTPVTPNSLNPPEAPFPEFHSVYIDPVSWKHYKETGKFREGTMFAKELVTVGATQATQRQRVLHG